MFGYKSIFKKILKIYAIVLFIIIVVHIVASLIIRNLITYNSIMQYTLFSIYVLTFVLFISYFVVSSKKHKYIINVLYNDCDPIKVLELLKEYNNDSIFKRTKVELANLEVMALFRSGNFTDALEILNNFGVDNYNVSSKVKILWEHNKVMVVLSMREYNLIDKYKNEFADLLKIYKNKKMFIDMYMDVQKKYTDFVNYNFNNLVSFYEQELKSCFSMLEKVTYNYNLAYIYTYLDDYNKSISKIDFIIEHGNTTFYYKKALELKERIFQNEKNI